MPATVKNPKSSLPRGLFTRGDVYWVNKTIAGTRHQFSTGCTDCREAKKVFQDFLKEHQVAAKNLGSTNVKPNLPKGLYWKGNVIWLSRMVEGKHYNLSTGTSDLKLAERYLEDFNVKAFKGERLGHRTPKGCTFLELADRYIEQGQIDGLRPKTIARYSAVRNHFIEFLGTRGLVDSNAKEITPDLIEDYKAWRASMHVNRNGWRGKHGETRTVARKTLRMEVQIVGTFYRNAVRLGMVESNPVEMTRSVKLIQKTPVFLEADEITHFLDAAASIDKWGGVSRTFGKSLHDIFLTYLKTGMRLDELRHLEWSDVNLNRNEITIRQEKSVTDVREIDLVEGVAQELLELGKQGFARLGVVAKEKLFRRKVQDKGVLGRITFEDFDSERSVLCLSETVTWNPKTRGRMIPISPLLSQILKGLHRSSNLVFPDPQGGGIWRFKVNPLVKGCAVRAEITKPIHTHVLRHTFATQLRRRGVPLETIKELLGHADIRETLVYAHFSPDEAKEAIPKIDFF